MKWQSKKTGRFVSEHYAKRHPNNVIPFKESKMAASVSLQWKGTNVCLDFICECGASGHLDSYFTYVIMCPMCGRKYGLHHEIGLIDMAKDTKTVFLPGGFELKLKVSDFDAPAYWADRPVLISHIECPECGDINSRWEEVTVREATDENYPETTWQLVCMHGHTIIGWPNELPEWLTDDIIRHGQPTY